MVNLFDEFAKAVASGMSRRQALVRMAGLFGASCAGWLGLGSKVSATPTGVNCATFCSSYRAGPLLTRCLIVCRNCPPTFTLCGPPGPSPLAALALVCTNLTIDPRNCGACGTVCSPPQVCVSGTCACPNGLTPCPCPTGQVCMGGCCVCPRGQTPCTTTTTSGTTTICCPQGQVCVHGACCPSSQVCTSFANGMITRKVHRGFVSEGQKPDLSVFRLRCVSLYVFRLSKHRSKNN